jgi:hypothetical protein
MGPFPPYTEDILDLPVGWYVVRVELIGKAVPGTHDNGMWCKREDDHWRQIVSVCLWLKLVACRVSKRRPAG